MQTFEEEKMLAEYNIDYSQTRPNRFAEKYQDSASVIRLDRDVAEIFPDSAAVNEALRFLARIARENHLPIEIRK